MIQNTAVSLFPKSPHFVSNPLICSKISRLFAIRSLTAQQRARVATASDSPCSRYQEDSTIAIAIVGQYATLTDISKIVPACFFYRHIINAIKSCERLDCSFSTGFFCTIKSTSEQRSPQYCFFCLFVCFGLTLSCDWLHCSYSTGLLLAPLSREYSWAGTEPQYCYCFFLLQWFVCLFVFAGTCDWLRCCSSTGCSATIKRVQLSDWRSPGINFDPPASPLCPKITGARPRFAEDLQSHKSAPTFVQDSSCMPEHTLKLAVPLISGHLNFPVTLIISHSIQSTAMNHKKRSKFIQVQLDSIWYTYRNSNLQWK